MADHLPLSSGEEPINYWHFFQQLLEAAPWPLIIIDRSLTIRFYNSLAVHLLEVAEIVPGTTLDQLIQDAAILQLVRESIRAEKSSRDELVRSNSTTAWKVSVTPLEHVSIEENAQVQPALIHSLSSSSRQEANPGAFYGHAGREEKVAIAQPVRSYAYFAIAIEDLTELRRLERVRRDFIANISHELRTPLASISLLAETLEEAIDTNRDQAQIFLEKIETEVQHLSALVSELLELSRIESGLVPMTIEPIEAGQLVREVMARMLPQAQRHRVMLRTELQAGEVLVAADSKQIARVLVNLVHNAIKFTPSGGVVTIGTLLQAGGQTQRFFVRDTGVGIRAEELPRIFERFYKADRARSKTDFIGPGGGGSGLGLAIARHVVEAHGGRTVGESIPGQGSAFSFTLPVAVRSDV